MAPPPVDDVIRKQSLPLRHVYDRFDALRRDRKPASHAEAADMLGVGPKMLAQACADYGEASTLDIGEHASLRAFVCELALARAARFSISNQAASIRLDGAVAAVSPLREDGLQVSFTLDPLAGTGGAEIEIDPRAIERTISLPELFKSSSERSISIFNNTDRPMLEISSTEYTLKRYFERIVELFERDWGAAHEPTSARSSLGRWPADAALLESAWMSTETRDEIEALIESTSSDRRRSYRALDQSLTRRVRRDAAMQALLGASQTKNQISIRIKNEGCAFTYSGPISDFKKSDLLVEAENDRMRRQLTQENVSEAWIARAPTREGLFTWLDCLDADGVSVIQMFGRRLDGSSLCTQGPGCWRALLNDFVVSGD